MLSEIEWVDGEWFGGDSLSTMNPSDTVIMNIEQTERDILCKIIMNQRRVYTLKQKEMDVKLLTSYYNEDLDLF